MTLRILILLLLASWPAMGCDELGDVFADEPSAEAAESIDESADPPRAIAASTTAVTKARDEAAAAKPSPGPQNVVGPCETIVVPHRFGAGWETLNHRIGRLEARLVDLDDCVPRAARVGLRGGAFANGKFFRDDATASFAAARVTGEPMRAARFTLRRQVEGGVDEGTIRIRRDAVGLKGERIVAVVGGIVYETDVAQSDAFQQSKYDPRMGFTLRGVGVGVRVAGGDDETIEVQYRLQFQPGAAPDRGRHNRAIAHARVGATLDVILLDVSGLPVHEVEHAYSMFYQRPGFGNVEQPPPNGDQIRVETDGAASKARGFLGLGEFRFDMKFGQKCSTDADCDDGLCASKQQRCAGKFGLGGDYLQSLLVSAEIQSFDSDTGRAVIDALGHVSNSSEGIAFRPLEYDFAARLLWVQTDGVHRLGPVEGALQKGAVLFSLNGQTQPKPPEDDPSAVDVR